MKNILTIFLLCSISFASEAKPRMFAEKYRAINNASEQDGFMFKRLTGKEIAEFATQQETGLTEQEKELINEASAVIMIVDKSDRDSALVSGTERLLESYEDLVSTKSRDTQIIIKATTKGDKITEMILALCDDFFGFMCVDIKFKRPILLKDYIDDPSKLINIEYGEHQSRSALADYISPCSGQTRPLDPSMTYDTLTYNNVKYIYAHDKFMGELYRVSAWPVNTYKTENGKMLYIEDLMVDNPKESIVPGHVNFYPYLDTYYSQALEYDERVRVRDENISMIMYYDSQGDMIGLVMTFNTVSNKHTSLPMERFMKLEQRIMSSKYHKAIISEKGKLRNYNSLAWVGPPM